MAEPVAEAASSSPIPEIARDLARRSIIGLPVGLLVGLVYGGWNGALSVSFGIGIVVVNFLLSAYMLSWAVQISYSLVTSVALGGFFMRMLIIGAAVLLVKDAAWVNLVLLGITIVITHLGLLMWEMRFVSSSMAHPGLKPKPSGTSKPAAGYR